MSNSLRFHLLCQYCTLEIDDFSTISHLSDSQQILIDSCLHFMKLTDMFCREIGKKKNWEFDVNFVNRFLLNFFFNWMKLDFFPGNQLKFGIWCHFVNQFLLIFFLLILKLNGFFFEHQWKIVEVGVILLTWLY